MSRGFTSYLKIFEQPEPRKYPTVLMAVFLSVTKENYTYEEDPHRRFDGSFCDQRLSGCDRV
jgi:hypothetical protein